jgi:hypothetical protein
LLCPQYATKGKATRHEMMILLFIVAAVASSCNKRDFAIYERIGPTFEERFRSFGGLWVSRDAYVDKIVNQVGLSRTCASCYGDAYICGWDNCKSACFRAGSSCTACLEAAKCIAECKKCTNFFH